LGRKTGKGAKTGAIIGIIAAVLSGGATLVGGIVAVAVGGGVLGTFFKNSLHLTKEEIQSEVLKICVAQGMQASNLGIPILAEELERN
jgi:hypothetical protein